MPFRRCGMHGIRWASGSAVICRKRVPHAKNGPFTVVLLNEERIVEHGTARVRWLLRTADGYKDAAAVPGARVQPLDACAGIVWRSRVELALSLGSILARVESRPAEPRHIDVLGYLERGARSAGRQERRIEFVVGPGGVLVRHVKS